MYDNLVYTCNTCNTDETSTARKLCLMVTDLFSYLPRNGWCMVFTFIIDRHGSYMEKRILSLQNRLYLYIFDVKMIQLFHHYLNYLTLHQNLIFINFKQKKFMKTLWDTILWSKISPEILKYLKFMKLVKSKTSWLLNWKYVQFCDRQRRKKIIDHAAFVETSCSLI